MKYLIPAILFLASCASAPITTPDKNLFYRNDMEISVGGYRGMGTLVVPKQEAEEFKFDISLPGQADVFLFDSCHREIVLTSPGKGGFFSNKKQMQITYDPLNGLETGGSCIVTMKSLNKEGKNSFGLVDFEGPDAVLPAEVKCNGDHYMSRGVTICQSKVGLIQEIIFPVEVAISPDKACPLELPADRKTFRFPLVQRQCAYIFLERGPARRIHRLTTVGYEAVQIQ